MSGPSPSDLSERERDVVGLLPATKHDVAETLDISPSTAGDHLRALKVAGVADWERDGDHYEWFPIGDIDVDATSGESTTADSDDGPDPAALNDREKYIVRQLQQGVALDTLADDLDEREQIVQTYLSDLRERGWRIYHDEDAGLYEIEGDHTLRSSEHIGTRTRKANRWWELSHNALERQWKRLEPTEVALPAAPGNEDWVTHISDLHAGDVVRDYAGDIVYQTDEIPAVVEYITSQSLSLAQKHNADYDTAHLLYGGDMVTNEAIYQGQFEDLDAWLDEQADVVQDALLEQIITFAAHFEVVNVVCQIGNHGVNRANGTSKHNNADLLVYKALRNFITKSQDHWDRLQNVRIKIGEARPYTPVELRGGGLHGHLRHGQDRKPQAETSARLKEWLSTLLDTINSSWGAFDIAWMGHHHVSGNIPWNGPPIIVSGSPKPSDDYVEQLGVKGATTTPREIAHCHGVSDDGITSIWPIDTRHYDRQTLSLS
jgi:DNA-binding CsgD family transcriptional regulator